ncbi:hypothetical protein [Brachybacterium sp. NPDC056505]|uniref:hypothetical protein n=1 Tax=Brachybacterium sp. NPDC056505 TaxID=3345843 RepID=UPI00366BDF30
MRTVTPAAFPETLPEVRIDVLEQNTAQSVVCDELQWWFVVPRAGETSSACWYDRGSRRRTMARETVSPVLPLPDDPDRVSIDIRERTFPAGALEPDERRIGFAARLTSKGADFLGVDMDGRRSDTGTRGFAEEWGTSRGRALRDGRRLVSRGPGEFRSVGDEGSRADLVTLTIGGASRRALRVLDLEPGSEPQEIAQPIIELETGRTLVYWQYRPEGWDADADAWLAAHRGEGLLIDGVRYQRRNCTGADTLAITDQAVRLFSLHAERPNESGSDSHG